MKKACLLAFVLVLALFAKAVYADDMSFGSAGDNKRVVMIPGETREFKLSFFNYGNTPLVVEMRTDGSREIKASISPRYFILEDSKNTINPMGEEEWVVLGDNYAKAVPVHVTLKIPNNISELSSNYHIVKIVAKAMAEGPGSAGTREKISQEREYAYAITVPGNIHAATMDEYQETLEQYYQEIESNKSGESDGEGFWRIGVKDSVGEETEERGQLPTGFFSLGGEEEGSVSILYLIIPLLAVVLIYIFYRRLRR